MRIVIAPDSLKECLSALDAARAIEAGVKDAVPDAETVLIPMADGGEGTVDALVAATDGRYVEEIVRGPLGGDVAARFGLLGDGHTAAIEMAAASGLPLVPPAQRNPLVTTTYGTGQLIRSAIDHGASKVIIGIGGSATVDGGAGMAQALGARLLNGAGQPIGPGGGALGGLDRIDMSEATGFARKKYLSFFGGPIVPLIGIIVFAVCLLVGGAIGKIPFIGPVLVGLLFFLAVLAGFLIVFIAIGGLFGVPLMFATVAMEGTDTFDAVSRAYSYIFGRPWRLIWYTLVAAAYGLTVTAFVLIFTSAMIAAPIYIGGWAMGANFDQIKAFLVNPVWAFPAETGLGVKIGGVLVKLTLIVVWGLALGFIASYKATAMTIIYGLLRKDVDGTDMTEVFLEEEQEEEFEAPEEPEAGEEPPAEEAPPEAPAEEPPVEAPAEEGEEEEKKEEGGSVEG